MIGGRSKGNRTSLSNKNIFPFLAIWTTSPWVPEFHRERGDKNISTSSPRRRSGRSHYTQLNKSILEVTHKRKGRKEHSRGERGECPSWRLRERKGPWVGGGLKCVEKQPKDYYFRQKGKYGKRCIISRREKALSSILVEKHKCGKNFVKDYGGEENGRKVGNRKKRGKKTRSDHTS